MRKSSLIVVGLVFVFAVLVTTNAYADAHSVNAWEGFWNSVGGFLYNALPWNWGGWAGQ